MLQQFKQLLVSSGPDFQMKTTPGYSMRTIYQNSVFLISLFVRRKKTTKPEDNESLDLESLERFLWRTLSFKKKCLVLSHFIFKK